MLRASTFCECNERCPPLIKSGGALEIHCNCVRKAIPLIYSDLSLFSKNKQRKSFGPVQLNQQVDAGGKKKKKRKNNVLFFFKENPIFCCLL